MPAELACVVMSYRCEPGLAEAVASLLDQGEPVELVVVNSGGGRPREALERAGFEVPVVDRRERLYPGGARNLGVEATSAPFVAFLAADCLAEPGWVAGRLREHRRGAPAVAGPVTNLHPDSAAARAFQIFHYARRMPGTPAGQRLLYGLSYSREVLRAHGPFDEGLRTGEDTQVKERLKAAGVAIAWADDVRTAHRHPVRLRDLLREQASRGGRALLALRALGRETTGLRVARYAVFDLPAKVGLCWRLAGPVERRGIVVAAPALGLAALAFASGALSAAAGARRRAEG